MHVFFFFSVGPCLKKNPSVFLLKSSKLEMECFFVTSRGFVGLHQKLSGAVAGCFLSDQCMFRMFGGL